MKRKRIARAVMPAKMSKTVRVKAAGGLVFRILKDENQVLLIYRNGVWDLPKGHVENGESIPGCAVREVMEEVGSRSKPEIKASLGTTEHSYTQENVEIEKETFWFVMNFPEATNDFNPQIAEGITKVEWVSTEKVEEIVGYQNLKDLIQKFRAHLS